MLSARPVECRFRRLRSIANTILIAILFVVPWVRVAGEPLVLLDIPQRKFHVLGLVVFPQELFFLWLIVAGLALGAGLGMFSEAAPALPVAEAGEETAILWSDPGLAETYWLAVERGTAVLDGASADDADEAVR